MSRECISSAVVMCLTKTSGSYSLVSLTMSLNPPDNSSSSSSSRNPSQNASSSSASSLKTSVARHRSSKLPSSSQQHEPYHIYHGATAYQQITSRGDKQPLLFSQSGFDVVGVLTRVAARPNPTVFIGSVDFSCAFLVADALEPDCPIVYASPPLVRPIEPLKHVLLCLSQLLCSLIFAARPK